MNTANDNVLFSNLVSRFERGELLPTKHNPPTTGKVYDSIVNHFRPRAVQEGSSFVIYHDTIKSGNTRIQLSAQRKLKGLYVEGEYDFPVRVVYPESEKEADEYFISANIQRTPKNADVAFNAAYPIGKWAEKMALESGLPWQILADRMTTILNCAFYASDGNPLGLNKGSHHPLTNASFSQSNTEDIPVDDALRHQIKRALSDFSTMRREIEYLENQGKTIKETIKRMFLLTSGRPSPGFLVVYLLDHFSSEFGGFVKKTPARILQHMNTNAEELFDLCKDFTRNQGRRHRSKIEIQDMMQVKN
jgi:hypothetical protein